MKERPIIFNAEMVRAILAGKKTQTRRIVRLPRALPQSVFEYNHIPKGHFSIMREGGGFIVVHWELDHAECIPIRCPYGQPGDRLWVRETFASRNDIDGKIEPDRARHYIHYRADNLSNNFSPAGIHNWHDYGGHWRPSIHMPRWASRITLEVVNVRVETVQDIQEHEVFWEGIEHCLDCDAYLSSHRNDGWHEQTEDFIVLWDSINAKRGYSWEVNPWVWVVEFRRMV